MNGVRRFLGGGSTPSTPSGIPSEPSTPPATAPLFFQSKGPSWPPSSGSPPSDNQSPPQTPADSPKTTTAALFFRRDKQRPQASSDDDYHNGVGMNGSRSSTHSSAFGSPRNSANGHIHGSPPRQNSSPGAGPSSPRGPLPPRVSQLQRKQLGDRGSSRSSGMMGSVRDDLLMSLLASEAIVDSRGYEILSSEEVEELKKEQQVLHSRLGAMTKKLTLETKIRDAALSLSKANSAYKAVSKQSSEQLDTANRKVDTAQKEVWKISERVNDIHRRLLEHRASVLSYSVRSLEKKTAGESDGDSSNITSGYSSPSRSTQMSPTPSSMTSILSSPSKGRFDGAHFFSGHSEAIIPRTPGSATPGFSSQVVAELEEKLHAAEVALQEANVRQGKLSREVSMLQLEKEQIETTLAMEVQTAEDTILVLEREAERMKERDIQLQAFEEEREMWMQNRIELEEKRQEVESLERRLEVLEERTAVTADIEGKLELERQQFRAERQQFRAELQRRDQDIQRRDSEAQRRGYSDDARDQEMEEAKMLWEADKTSWEVERETMTQELRLLQAKLHDASSGGGETRAELDAAFDSLQQLANAHGVLMVSRDGTILALVASISAHVVGLNAKIEAAAKAQEDLVAARAKLEDDVRAGLDKREALYSELDQARKERDEAKVEARNLQADLQAASFAAVNAIATPGGPTVEYTGDAASIIAMLKPIWAVLPSPEARTGKLGARFRTASPTSSPVASKPSTSLSEMDVRSLKTLYNPATGHPSSPSLSSPAAGNFTIEAFVERVHALISDDRALIERLIRFAQAHDLLKKNAERAQKLAQESNIALETYQKQVKTLEERNRSMTAKQAALQDEIHHLQETVDRISAEKLEIETQAAEQAETCAQLTDANNTLSARALIMAQESASSTDHIRKQLERQLSEANAALSKAKAEIESVRQSQQTTQMAMMEELNSIQTENDNLRNQLRAKK